MGLLDIGNYLTDPSNSANLGLITGLLQASGPTRLPISTTQAIGMGIQGANAGRMQSLQMQQEQQQLEAQRYNNQMMHIRLPYILSKAQALSGQPVGNPEQQGAPAAQPGQTYDNQVNQVDPNAPYMAAPNPAISAQPYTPVSQPAQGLLTPQSQPSTGLASASVLGSPQADALWAQGDFEASIGLPGGAAKMTAAVALSPYAHDPTAQAAMAAGYLPGSPEFQAIVKKGLDKATYIPPASIRPGGFSIDPHTGQATAYPAAAPKGFGYVQDPNSQTGWRIAPVPGGVDALAAESTAEATGKASFDMKQVYNDKTGRFDWVPATQVAGAAGGGIPGNNPGNLRPNGASTGFQSYPTPEAGLAAIDNNLKAYGSKGINTLAGVINRWAPPSENDTASYIADVSKRLGIKPNQQIDLSRPEVRQALSTAIMLHEQGPSKVFGQASSPMSASAPLGTPDAASSSQAAPSKQMATQQQSLTDQDSVYQQSRDSLLGMIHLAKNPSAYDTASRFLPDSVATRVNNDAAKYEKYHSNYIALQGKALGAGGTDSARQTIEESVPDFSKPQEAKLAGLQSQLNQLDLSHLKRQVLSPTFQTGNEKAYTEASAKFDSVISPSIMPKVNTVLQVPPGKQRAALLMQMSKDPKMKQALTFLAEHGVLK